MANILHGCARTTPRIRAELQASQESARTLARRYGLNPKTVAKWKRRSDTLDAPMGPRQPRSTVLTEAQEAIVVEFRRRTLLPLDDVLGCLRDTIPNLTRSALHRCLQRHGISRLPVNPEKTSRRGRFAETTIGYVHIDSCELRLQTCKLHMNRTIKDATTKSFHYEDAGSLKAHVLSFVAAYNFAKHLKALRWRTPFQSIVEAWKRDPLPFKIDPHHLTPGPHTHSAKAQRVIFLSH